MNERDLFITAFEIDDESARREYLDSACAGDRALRDRVERLLNRAAVAGNFLEQPAADLCSDIASDVLAEPNEPPGDGGEAQTVIGKVDDTAQTILTNAQQTNEPEADAPLPNVEPESQSVFGTLFGRYRVERVLGSGGMGVVYLAEDLRLGRRVALKIPKFDADGRFKLIERFRREARTMASVVHRNLCPIFDVDEQAGTHYLTMAFIDGESLSAILKQGASFTERQIAELIRKLAQALEKAHRAGVIHRDLKPANVMIDHDGEPILMDFGLAWMAHESDSRVTQSGAIVGTPAYMAPEQAEGEPEKVSAASDIYSLGAMLYELLTGQPIHTGSVTRVLFKLMHNEPTRPSQIRSEINPQLEAICWKAISRRPEDRFASAAEFAESLTRFLEGRPWDDLVTRSVSEGERSTASAIPSLVKHPPSLARRVSESDRTDVLPTDTSAETIAYQNAGEPVGVSPRTRATVRGLTPAGSPGSRSGSHGTSHIVLASVLLIGVLGAVWAIVGGRIKPIREDIGQSPTTPVAPGTKSDDTKKQATEIGPPTAIAPFNAKEARAHQEAWAQHLGTAVENTNSVGMQMILIPPGEFLMGAPNNDADAQAQEKPQHKVTLTKPFYLSATEVTVGQFRKFVEATKYVTEAERDGQGAFDVGSKIRRPSFVWHKMSEVGSEKSDDYPVCCVSWEDARQFCEWLGKAEGREYRLPTDAEWEFACRAGTQTRYSFGNEFDRTQLAGTNGSPLSPVARFPANPFGLFDMHGNLNEICWDAGRTFTADPIRDPVGSLIASTPAVVRGGAVSSAPIRHRSSQRYLNDSRVFPDRDFATRVKGFRIVRLIERSAPSLAIAPFDSQRALAYQQEWAKHLGVPVEYENGVGIKFRLLPPGEFLMGTDNNKIEKSSDEYWAAVFRSETAQHTVRLPQPFYLGVYEVTQQQFQRVMGRNPSAYSASGRFAAAVAGLDTNQHPVDSVTWFEAVEFCNQLSQSEGLPPYYSREADVVTPVGGPGYRLPSEAEWEFACRAGTYGRWAWGDEPDRAADFAWYKDNPEFAKRTIPIGTKAANPFGLHDLHGNISEWCQDWQAPYPADAVENPIGPRDGTEKIYRGGSWNDVTWFGRAALRLRSPPAHAHSFLGLRVAFGGHGEFPKSLPRVASDPPKDASPNPPQPGVPKTFIVLNPADSGLTIHDPQWKLTEVIRPQGRVFSTRFDREGRLYFAIPERRDNKSPPPGLYRVQPDGTFQPLVQADDWEFVFTPDEQRCFTHRGTMGTIAEVDLKTGMSIREVDMSPSDDGPTSPYFAPAWYRGTLVQPNEYLFADFGTTKRKPPSTGGIWKFGSDMAAPERLLTMPEGGSVVHALAFGRDQLFVATVKGNSGSLATFDGQQLVVRPTETLPSIGNMVFDPSDGSLLASEFDGHAILRIDLSQPNQPANVKPILSGFCKLNFGVMSLTQNGQRLAVVDFESNTIYVFARSARGAQAVPVKQAFAAPLKLELAEQLPSVKSATGLKLGDLDGDGDLDLFVAMLKAPCVMLRNDGRGHFTDSGQQLGDNASFAVALGDLDGDGDLDAFVCNSDDQENAIWLNDGRGTFQRSTQSFPPGTSNDVALADIDGDKDLDVVVSNWQGPATIWINDGSGHFINQQTIARIRNTGLALGDLDGDGDSDLVMTSFGGDNRVWFNDGQGHFTDSEQQLELFESSSVALGDLDRDGDLDLFVTSNQGNQVWFNDSHGRFQASEQRLGDGPCEAVELVDLDADHDLDAVTIGGGFEFVKPRAVWRNDGKGRFAKDATTLKSGRSQSLTSGDLDGDGDADVILGNLAEPAEIWLNQSNQSTIP